MLFVVISQNAQICKKQRNFLDDHNIKYIIDQRSSPKPQLSEIAAWYPSNLVRI